jgi:hypothetical protein
VQPADALPDRGTVLAGSVIVISAVTVWGGFSLTRNGRIEPLETEIFALVFVVVYFGSLSVLGRDTSDIED